MELNAIFSDRMVLQANKPVRIFGTGTGTAAVELAGQTARVTSAGGDWLVELPAFDYGGPYVMTVDLDGKVQTLTDLWFGDIYLLAGQSNNQFKLWQSNTPKEYYRDNDNLRLFTVDRLEDEGKHVLTADGWKSFDKNGKEATLEGEHYESREGWIPALQDEVQFWPALGYLSGSELTRDSEHKIGLIACYQGASVIQAWLPEHDLEGTALFVEPELRADGAKNPAYRHWNGDGMLYSGMLKTILPFSLKAVLWYQGEANTTGKDGQGTIYEGILTRLIQIWRTDFRDETLPFLIVQIHDYVHGLKRPGGGWRNVQTAQESVCRTVLHTCLIKSADLCETDDIHPKSKLALAQRIARTVRNVLG